MKIAILHNFYRSTAPSGENQAVLAQFEALRRAGHDVVLFSTDSDDIDPGLRSRISTGFNVIFNKGASFESEIKRFNPDVVHLHNSFPQISTSWLSQTNFPLVVTAHNFRPFCAAGTLSLKGKDCLLCVGGATFNAIKNKCYRGSVTATIPLAIASRKPSSSPSLKSADVIVTLSEWSQGIYVANTNLDAKILLISNFSKNSIVPNSHKYEKNKNWIFVGRLSEEKGILELISSWPSDETLDIFGDGPLREGVENLISGKQNIAYRGILQRGDLTKNLRAARALIFPSTCRENAPMIYVEALECGLPVVAYGGNSVAQSVIDDGVGTVFKNWNDLALAMQSMKSKEAEYREAALLAHKRKYSESVWLQNIETAYETAIQSRVGRA